MTSQSWRVGQVRITSLVETDAGKVIQSIIPQADQENITGIPWLIGDYADPSGNLKAVVQSFIVEVNDLVVMVDTCVGNGKKREEIADWNYLKTDFLDRLESLGWSRDAIDIVICTHLHFDHVGWNTIQVQGEWQPTFSRAQYFFCEDEYNYWRTHPDVEIEDDHAGIADSVEPIVAAGRALLVPSDSMVTDGISFIPSPGHTPGHASVLIESEGQTALITGDAMHHPVQIACPAWGTESDTDSELASRSRRAILDRYAGTETLVIGSHFAEPSGGYIEKSGDSFRFVKDIRH